MRYTDLCGEKVSQLGMGAMRLPTKSRFGGHRTGNGAAAVITGGSVIDTERAQRVIDAAVDAGVNYFDTAYIYHKGKSESFLGKALAKRPRESYFLATKFFIAADPRYKSVFKKQLSRLGTDYVDFYLMHSVVDLTRKSYGASGAIEYFQQQKEAGRIHHLGFSSHMGPEGLKKMIEAYPWDFVQLQLNYADWFNGNAAELYRIAEDAGLPVIVMEPVKGGRLADLGEAADRMLTAREPDRSVPSWAMRFLLRLPQVKVVLSGMNSVEQMQDNAAVFSEGSALTDEEVKLLHAAYARSGDARLVPCTACRYCADSCPKHIDIPVMMDLYNRRKRDSAQKTRDEIDRTARRADTFSACIACGKCMQHCPQQIQIPQIMAELQHESMHR